MKEGEKRRGRERRVQEGADVEGGGGQQRNAYEFNLCLMYKLCIFNVCLRKMYVVVRTSCLIITKYITIYLKSKPSSYREILIKKSPIFKPSCLLCYGEVITKGSNCVIYVTV